jgi:hypothetical protein
MFQEVLSRHMHDGQYENYFSWIGNFGVVPLLEFDFFRLAPALFFFAALLFFVTRVLETITPLLIINCVVVLNNKLRFLPFLDKSVKGLLVLMVSFHSSWLYAESLKDNSHDVIITRGQSMELSLPELSKFNIGSKEAIQYKFNESKKTLFIRGKQIGHSEIVVWNKSNQVETFQVSVISKIQESKLFHLTETLNLIGLNPQMSGTHIRVTGEIKSLQNFISFTNLKAKNNEIIIDEASLATKVSRQIIGEIYQKFFNDFKDSIQCEVNQSEILCSYHESESSSEALKKYYEEKYGVIFSATKGQQTRQNYNLKIKLIQLEQLDGEELRLGLEQIDGTLGEIIGSPISNIIKKNKILLAQTNVSLSTLAEPEIILRPEVPGEIQIGSEIPFQINKNVTAWKFAGLRIKVKLENIGDKLKINFETELTEPSMNSINQASVSGTIGKSSIIISLKEPSKIFQISLRTQGRENSKLPYLGSIPLLGELFKSKSKQDNFKTITGIIEVKTDE